MLYFEQNVYDTVCMLRNVNWQQCCVICCWCWLLQWG